VKNTIRVSAPFSFKGETFKPTTILDLGQLIKKDGLIPDLHHMLAAHNDVDTYSYAFEVMQQSELYFDNATGLAGEYLQDGCFDFQAYITKSEEIELHSQLQQIAKDTLNIDDLTEEPEIKDALIHAYQLGLNSH
jgi:hypothetical protein